MVSVLTAACLVLAAAGCGKVEEKVAPKSVFDWFEIGVGERVVEAQVAVRDDEMARGLMGRRDLGENQGMLFVYDRPQRMSFWMRNTPTPLDIGFFSADGTLREIYAMNAFDETGVRSAGAELLYALEMRQGWFAKNGVRVGARLDLEAVRTALRERGFGARAE